jgi:hypothetical protein
MKLILAATVALSVLSCGGGEDEPPTCQRAMTAFYDDGCQFFEAETGTPIPLGEMISACLDVRAEAPAQCQDDLDGLLFCLESGPSDCDCSVEQEQLLTCE